MIATVHGNKLLQVKLNSGEYFRPNLAQDSNSRAQGFQRSLLILALLCQNLRRIGGQFQCNQARAVTPAPVGAALETLETWLTEAKGLSL